jgi:predicted RNA binding protein YcfA (HicA-like mRNA interferase family)
MSKDEKLIRKIAALPCPTDISYPELEKYYRLHGFFPEKQDATSHVQFKNQHTGRRGTVKNKSPVKPSYVKEAVRIVHEEEEK